VSQGGSPDLAGSALGLVRAPTLLIVGDEDKPVFALNREVFLRVKCREKKLVIIPSVTHLFVQTEALEEVAQVAAGWFSHLTFAAKAQGA